MCLFSATIVLCREFLYTTRIPSGVGQTPPDATKQDQACRLQIIRRSHHHSLPEQPRWRGRAERVWQVECHRCRTLGHGRKLGEPPSGRFHHRRDIQRLEFQKTGWRRIGRIAVRQFGDNARRAICQVLGNRHTTRGSEGRDINVLPERHTMPPKRHYRRISWHRARPAQLLDHRAGHDFQGDRGKTGRNADLHRGSCRYFEIQGAPPGDLQPYQAYQG